MGIKKLQALLNLKFDEAFLTIGEFDFLNEFSFELLIEYIHEFYKADYFIFFCKS